MGRQDAESETLIPTTIDGGVFDVSHALRGEGFDASEDGTGRGTPLVAATLTRGAESAGKGGYAGRRQEDDENIVVGEPYAFQARIARNGRGDMGDTINALATQSGETGKGDAAPCVAVGAGVRRLMPPECARLQGMPDDHARIPWKGKPAEQCPDGPQYKAYGNSMSVNVMRWIGRRIDLMESLIREGRV